MSLAELAASKGVKTKPVSAIVWLDEHQELVSEIDECRAKGYTWKAITALLREHYGYRGSDDALCRAMSDR